MRDYSASTGSQHPPSSAASQISGFITGTAYQGFGGYMTGFDAYLPPLAPKTFPASTKRKPGDNEEESVGSTKRCRMN